MGAREIEQPADKNEGCGRNTAVGPERGQGGRADRSQPDAASSDEPLAVLSAHQVRTDTHRGEDPQKNQARQAVRAGNGEEKHRGGRSWCRINRKIIKVIGSLEDAVG